MAIEGYASATSVLPGRTIDFHLSMSPAGTARLRLERVGSDFATAPRLFTLARRPIPATEAWMGFGWPVTWTFTIPATWPTGLYRLTAGAGTTGRFATVLEFVVRPVKPGRQSKILYAVDFVTEEAYNGRGGRSFYDSASGPRVARVSFNRPPKLLADAEHFIGWLRDNGIVVEFASMVDLHTTSGLLKGYACLVFGPHAEYWSKEMRDQVEQFIQRGGHVLALSGNTCYRQVRFENDTRTLVCYKNASADTFGNLAQTTVAFAQPPLNRPPNSMLGVGMTHGAWADGAASRPYQIHFPSHWVFDGAAFASRTAPTTTSFLAYESDAADFVLEREGYPRVTGVEGTPLSTVVLASADLGHWTGKPGMATATLYIRHGMVFASGTTHWIKALGTDAIVATVTRNLLARCRQPRAFDWEHIGSANHVTAMAAVEGKLFAATERNRLWQRYPVLAEARWRNIGHANDCIAMAATRGLLFAITRDNTLWSRRPLEADIRWTRLGTGPSAGVRALCASGSTLYAVDGNGRLQSLPSSGSELAWRAVNSMPRNNAIVAMTSYHGVLLAATSTNDLLRTGFDFVEESRAWVRLHHCNGAKALAVVDNMLLVATSDNELWWLDLHHGALDRLSTET